MKKGCGYYHDTGLLILRLLLASVFMFHVLPKFGAGAGMISFIGWAPIALGLTFFSAATWFYLAVIGELVVVITMLLGRRTRLGSVVLLILMFFAMSAKRRGFPAIELDLLLSGLAIVMLVAWPGKFSMTKACRRGCMGERSKK
jgi:uncharacterized membrane protein YphA (DoxX/SURF4 family)